MDSQQTKDLQYFKIMQDILDDVRFEKENGYFFTLLYSVEKGWNVNIPAESLIEFAERYAAHREQKCKEEHALQMRLAQERISERISIAVADAESEWQKGLQKAKEAAWNEGYEMGSARESSMHIAPNPYKEKGGEDAK